MPNTSNNTDVFAQTIAGGGSLSSNFALGYFGDGSDGDVTISTLVQLGKEMHYNNLTITSTGTLKPFGYRIFVKGTLTIQAGGSINDDGNSATGMTGGAILNSRNYLVAAAGQGANGRNTTGNGTIGNGSGGNSSLNNNNVAPSGGAGGIVPLGAAGGGGSAAQPSPNQKWASQAIYFGARLTNGGFGGGAAGGSGGCNVGTGTAASGGGGGGGGICWVAAYKVVNAGRISANGGNGGNATATGDGAAGGGGGGGGGCVALITTSPTYGNVTADGGIAGTSIGATTQAVNGTLGSSIVLVLS